MMTPRTTALFSLAALALAGCGRAVEPSDVKLKALLKDANEMARTFATLDPAWGAVQMVARMFGIL